MNPSPLETLDTLLGYLGFAFRVEEQNRDGNIVLQVYTSDAEILLGHHGQTLEDLQYLVNRLVLAKDPKAPRIVVDVEHHRAMRDDAMVASMRQLAEGVRHSGRAVQTELLNSYDRRLVHNAFKDDPEVMTWSPQEDARTKRITLKPRR